MLVKLELWFSCMNKWLVLSKCQGHLPYEVVKLFMPTCHRPSTDTNYQSTGWQGYWMPEYVSLLQYNSDWYSITSQPPLSRRGNWEWVHTLPPVTWNIMPSGPPHLCSTSPSRHSVRPRTWSSLCVCVHVWYQVFRMWAVTMQPVMLVRQRPSLLYSELCPITSPEELSSSQWTSFLESVINPRDTCTTLSVLVLVWVCVIYIAAVSKD